MRQKKESYSGRTRSDSNSSLDSFERRLRNKAGSNLRPADLSSSLDNFEERLRQKKESYLGRTRSDSNSSLDSFERRMWRKANEGGHNKSGRMQQKVERSDNKSSDSFQRRLAAKIPTNPNSSFESSLHHNQNSGSSRPGAESVSITRAMDSFQSRLTKKMSEGSFDSTSRDPSPMPSSFDDRLHKKLTSDLSMNETRFEERLQRKLSGDNRLPAVRVGSFDERLQNKLSSQRSSSSAFSKDRLQRKLDDQDQTLSKGSESAFAERLQKQRSDRSIPIAREEGVQDSFNQKRLQRKLTDEDRLSSNTKGKSIDKEVSESVTSQQSSSFEERLQKKLSGNRET